MSELDNFIVENAVEYSKNRVENDFISTVEKELGVSIGEQLKCYILNYGYLAFKFVELNGITANQALCSDMVKTTHLLHKNFSCTQGLIALEDAGDGDFFLIDSQDNVFEFIPELGNEVKSLNKKLLDYIHERFVSILRL